MGEFSLTHILLIAFIFLIFFGLSKLPQLGQSLGRAIRGFKEGLSEIDGQARNLPPKDKDSNQQLNHEQQNAQAEKQSQPESSTQKKS